MTHILNNHPNQMTWKKERRQPHSEKNQKNIKNQSILKIMNAKKKNQIHIFYKRISVCIMRCSSLGMSE